MYGDYVLDCRVLNDGLVGDEEAVLTGGGLVASSVRGFIRLDSQ